MDAAIINAADASRVITVQTGELVWRPADGLAPAGAVFLLVIGLVAVAVFLRTEPALFARSGDQRTNDNDEPLSQSDMQRAERLDKLMTVDRVYRDPGLSVGGLAARLGIAEHELRRLINRKLGHRNFAAFLNERRLAEAKQALIDPSQRGVPISTIALDAGFGSMGPFNRAFKQATGVTPTEYRVRSARDLCRFRNRLAGNRRRRARLGAAA